MEMFGHEDISNEVEIASILVKVEIFYEDAACFGIVEDGCETHDGRCDEEDISMGFKTSSISAAHAGSNLRISRASGKGS